ncbi:MAG TPA: hypothetical protein VNA25_25275 [Phycisphaerae bacterium]|nr:hypothetical protein [Phycisphaerae bacterium]
MKALKIIFGLVFAGLALEGLGYTIWFFLLSDRWRTGSTFEYGELSFHAFLVVLGALLSYRLFLSALSRAKPGELN